MLQNPSKYKIRPSPTKKADDNKLSLNKKPSGKNLSPVLTKELLKNGITSSPVSGGSGSPCENKAVEITGMERAYTFNVEEGALGWNLLENNTRRDAIPPEPVALNEARLLCREAMTLITEEVSVLWPKGRY